MMKPEIKRAWVKALRSGKYKQGLGRLRTLDDEYCCLGVLCDVYGVEWMQSEQFKCYVADASTQTALLPQKIVRETRIPESELTRLNDVEELSFPEIADWIEANL